MSEDSEHWKRERSGGATDGIDLRIRKEDANASADPLHMFFAIMCCTMKKALDQARILFRRRDMEKISFALKPSVFLVMFAAATLTLGCGKTLRQRPIA